MSFGWPRLPLRSPVLAVDWLGPHKEQSLSLKCNGCSKELLVQLLDLKCLTYLCFASPTGLS